MLFMLGIDATRLINHAVTVAAAARNGRAPARK